MARRERGFTLIEILVVITIIATLAGMVAALAPKMIREGKKTDCQNNLRQIGQLLQAAEASRSIKNYSGAAFLLQVKDELTNDQLKVFICPGDDGPENDPRPKIGSDEFVAMYRNLELPAGVDQRTTSYAGPEHWQAPKTGPAKFKTWLWGCDSCRNDQPYHDGICVLYNNTSVGFWKLDDLKNVDKEAGLIQVGEGSGDERLARMRFLPTQ